MNATVIALAEKLKILNSVISAISVDMVDMLILGQWATKVFLHNQAMQIPQLAGDSEPEIPRATSVSTAPDSCLSRTRSASLNLGAANLRTTIKTFPLCPSVRMVGHFAGLLDRSVGAMAGAVSAAPGLFTLPAILPQKPHNYAEIWA